VHDLDGTDGTDGADGMGGTGRSHGPLRHNRDFLLLWGGGAVSELGTSMSAFVYPLLGYALTGSTTSAAAAGSGFAVGVVVAGLPAGVLVDRWNRRAVLLAVNTGAAVVAAGLVGAAAAGRLTLPLLVVAAFLTGAATSFVGPAETAALRWVVPSEQLGAAFSQNQARRHVGALIGPPVAGSLYVATRWLPLLGDALSFLVAGAAAALLRTDLPAPPHPAGEATGLRRELVEGVRYLLQRSALRGFTLFAAVANVSGEAVVLVLTLKLLRAGVAPVDIGLVNTIGAVAGIAGAFLAPRVMPHVRAGLLICVSGAVSATAVIPLAFSNDVLVCGACMAVSLFSVPACNASLAAFLVAVTPDRLQGRVWAGLDFACSVVWPVGPLLGGVALSRLGGRDAMLVCAALGVVAVSALVLNPALRTLPTPDRWGPEHGVLSA
jgi:MFS family permease